MNTVSNNIRKNVGLSPLYDQWIQNFFQEGLVPKAKLAYSDEAFVPKADISEDEQAYFIALSLAGFKKEDIKIETEENKLTVNGKREFVKEENNKKTHLTESNYGSFSRAFKLPKNVNIQAIEALYENGILEIKIPKAEEKNAKNVIVIK